jgi:hypothetical protein
MERLGFIKSGDRHFPVKSAAIDQCGEGQWFIEINAEKAIYDSQTWQPRLYHQGLDLGGNSVHELSGISTSWVHKMIQPIHILSLVLSTSSNISMCMNAASTSARSRTVALLFRGLANAMCFAAKPTVKASHYVANVGPLSPTPNYSVKWTAANRHGVD